MKRGLVIVSMLLGAASTSADQGMRGDPEALADAVAMVESMGGTAVWAQMNTLHLVHEWYPWNRVDSYVEHETLDLTGPRSRAERKSEIDHAIRAYSPEGGRWDWKNGELTLGGEEALARDLARAEFNFYQLAKAIAVDDPRYEVRYGEGDIPTTRRLEFYGPDQEPGGWVILNARKEPIVKATPAYRYTLGPLKRFGNLRLPAWGVYDNGWTRYELLDADGDRNPPAIEMFMPPRESGAR